MKTLFIWTYGCTPMIMGGSCYHLLGISYKVNKKISLGKGFYGYIINGPDHKTVIAEAKTGAAIGGSLKMVKNDIATGESSIMKEQIKKARYDLNSMLKKYDFNLFWEKM
jgi:hypothetical protein